jgi:hypothetical protein
VQVSLSLLVPSVHLAHHRNSLTLRTLITYACNRSCTATTAKLELDRTVGNWNPSACAARCLPWIALYVFLPDRGSVCRGIWIFLLRQVLQLPAYANAMEACETKLMILLEVSCQMISCRHRHSLHRVDPTLPRPMPDHPYRQTSVDRWEARPDRHFDEIWSRRRIGY